ncbi:MAG: hypothetical protein R2759_05650 [Bacteroidales bacterium]
MNYREDSRPTANGVYVATDDYPRIPATNTIEVWTYRGGTYYNGEFARIDNLENQKQLRILADTGINLSGKIDVRTTQYTNLTFEDNSVIMTEIHLISGIPCIITIAMLT